MFSSALLVMTVISPSGPDPPSFPERSSSSRSQPHQSAGKQRQKYCCEQQKEIQGGVWRGCRRKAAKPAQTWRLSRHLCWQRGRPLQDRCALRQGCTFYYLLKTSLTSRCVDSRLQECLLLEKTFGCTPPSTARTSLSHLLWGCAPFWELKEKGSETSTSCRPSSCWWWIRQTSS